jgi:hypothetical protein
MCCVSVVYAFMYVQKCVQFEVLITGSEYHPLWSNANINV